MACGFVGRFTLTPGDWEALSRGPFDIIVSNPPYIRSDDIAYLPPEVRDFDPRLALDGGPDGLAAYRLLAPLLRSRLAPKGLALLEVGYDQAEAVADILVNESLNCLEPRRDFGGHQRVVMAGLKDFLRRN